MPDLKQQALNAIERCPHCGQETGLEVSPSLRYRCRICGGPRVPIVGVRVERSDREAQLLRTAKRAGLARLWYRLLWIASGVAGGFSFIAMLLTLLLFSGLGTAWASLLLIPAMPLLLAFWARRRTFKSREQQEASLQNAWASAAHELLSAKNQELTSEQVAQFMLTDEQHADQLLARLNVDDAIRSRVTDAGQVTYSVRAPERLRVPAAAVRDETLAWDDPLIDATEDFIEPPSNRRKPY